MCVKFNEPMCGSILTLLFFFHSRIYLNSFQSVTLPIYSTCILWMREPFAKWENGNIHHHSGLNGFWVYFNCFDVFFAMNANVSTMCTSIGLHNNRAVELTLIHSSIFRMNEFLCVNLKYIGFSLRDQVENLEIGLDDTRKKSFF